MFKWWPIVLKKTMETTIIRFQEDRVRSERSLLKEIEETKKAVSRIVDRCSMIRWFDKGDYYQLNLQLDPRCFRTGFNGDQEIMAEMIARRVQAEIATSKFIGSEREEKDRFNTFNGNAN